MLKDNAPSANVQANRAAPAADSGGRCVLFVSTERQLGGAEKSLLSVLHHSPPPGLRPVLLCRPEAAIGREARRTRVEVVELPLVQRHLMRQPFGYVFSLLRLWWLGVRLRPVVIFGDGWRGIPYAVPLGRLLGVPSFVHTRDTDIPPSWLTRALCRAADFTTQVSRWQQRFLVERGLIHPHRCRLVYNGLEPEIYLREGRPAEAHRAELGLAPGELGVVLPGYLLPWKGGEAYLEAARLLAKEYPHVRFFFLGGHFPDTGSTENDAFPEKIQQQAEALGLSDRVRFLGHRDGVAEVLWRMDIAVVPTITEEAFGRVAAEAMMAGLPVVVARSGGLPEVVAEGETGLVVPKENPAALAEALRKLIDDADLRRCMGEAGRKRALRLFQAERKAEEMWDAIAEVAR